MSHTRRDGGGRRVGRVVLNEIADLYPGYFALVMATGIVSIALHQQGLQRLAQWLLNINIVAYASIWLLMLARLVRYPRRIWGDLLDPARAPGFLTVVAGTSVLGRQFILVFNDTSVAFALWVLSALLWLILIYAFFAVLICGENKLGIERGLHGGWLLTVVATQAVALLGTRVAERAHDWRETTLLAMLLLYLLGCVLYLLLAALILYQLVFLRPPPARLTPLYWITMGAASITVLAGSTLIERAAEWAFLVSVQPFLIGFTLLFWATATWWIPLLVVIGAWRHLYRHLPICYEPQYWGMVFPLGMYAAATFEMAMAIDEPALLRIPHYVTYVAVLAWAATFFGMIHRLLSLPQLALDVPPEPLSIEEA